MKVEHLKEMTTSALTASYLALTDSLVVLVASSGQVQDKLVQAANTVQSILTGLVILAGICVAPFITIKRTPDADDPQEKSEVHHAVSCIARLVALVAVIIWFLP